MRTHQQLLVQLARVRGRYLGSAAATKLALLAALERTPLHRPSQLAALHAHLLFLRAFPDDRRVCETAESGLRHFAARARLLPRRARTTLDDSGVAGSASRHTFDARIARWLSERFPRDAEIDWSSLAGSRELEALFALVALRAEHDGFENPETRARHWLRGAKGALPGTDLAWLLRQLWALHAPEPMTDALYDKLAIPIIWRLRDSAGATTYNLLPVRQLTYRVGFRSPPLQPSRWIATPLRHIRRLERGAARRVLDVARAALTARCREVYALSCASADEVYVADLGQGAALALYGVSNDRRLCLEANYGYLLLANGIPIGYGGVTALYRQANTGINIFEPFRGSEAAFLWVQTLRVFSTLFGTRRFIVNPYQFGAGNNEAIASGAFWFYYRLGFRPVEERLARLATNEWQRQRSQRGYRTPKATLRRLASDDLELTLRGARARDRFPEEWLSQLALRASEVLASAGGKHRAADAQIVSARVARALRAGRRAAWPAAEREAFAALAPLVALLDLEALDARARARLVRLMRKKGAPQESSYVRAAARNPQLIPGLMELMRARAVS